jgi:hypothetical protein
MTTSKRTTSGNTPEDDRLLTPAEVGMLFRVDPRTVLRWHKAGVLGSVRTLGGQRRYREGEVAALLAADGVPGEPYDQARWLLACGHHVSGRADAHEGTGMLYCAHCPGDSAVAERTAWILPIPEEHRLRVTPRGKAEPEHDG